MRPTSSWPRPILSRLFLAAALASALPGCVEEVTVAEPPPDAELGVGESRTVELRFLRFDVEGFAQRVTLEDLRELPQATLEEMWLLDLDVRPLVSNVLQKLTFLPTEEAYALPRPAHNLWKQLNMTPETADLSGTSLESLLGVGKAVGLAPSKILADLVQIDENERIITTETVVQGTVENVIATHPNTKLRRGPITSEHPDGIYPVAPASIPVSLADFVSNFAGLAERYGPAPLDPEDPDGAIHPGFIQHATEVIAAEDDFVMVVKVNANASPFKGIDATFASTETINSTISQIDTLFDFSDPGWLSLEGVPDAMSIGELTMAIQENDAFLPAGNSKNPEPTGNSPAWDAPPWEFEHLLIETGMIRAGEIGAHCTVYGPEGEVDPPFEAVEVCIDSEGWTTLSVDPSVVLDEPPPPPSYFWDILVEVSQTRLHDGGLAEGEADIEITVQDVPIGIATDDLVAQIRENMEQNPENLTAMAVALTDNSTGDPDFYYMQARQEGAEGDWLYFIAPEDIRDDEEGAPVRPYAYGKPGFFADAELTEKISSTDAIDGDTSHEKVKIDQGMKLYMEDDAGRRYEIAVGQKPSPHRIALTLTRLQ